MLKVEAIGNLGRDPEMRYTPSGQPVTSFSIACNRSYNNQAGEKVTETTWLRVTAWGKQAEVCNQFLKKGRQVYVEGRLAIDPATGGPRIFTRQDGTPGTSYELTAENIQFLGGRGEGSEGEGAAESMSAGEDIPF
jgi:single-strand DNA-binding protein